MEFKGIDKAVNSSHSVTVGNTKYSTYHITERPNNKVF